MVLMCLQGGGGEALGGAGQGREGGGVALRNGAKPHDVAKMARDGSNMERPNMPQDALSTKTQVTLLHPRAQAR